MQKRFFVREINDMEMVTCDTCKGTGKIIGSITSDVLAEPIKDHELSCPICNGSGKVSTGKILHYAVGTVYLFGTANVTDNDKTVDFNLGFVCDDPEMIEKYKEANHITDFTEFPGALRFYGMGETLYDTLEEAQKIVDEKQAAWTPDNQRNELKLVKSE